MKPRLGEALKKHRLPTAVLGAAVEPSGARLYAACMDGVYELDLEGGEAQLLDKHASYVSGAVLAVEADTLITAGYDGALQWFDLAAAKRVRRIELHEFWSWQMALSPDQQLVASVTGQYLAGDYEYRPAPESEPSVCVLAAASGEVLHKLAHVPSVQSVAFSPDSRYLAAGNLMGEIRVWDVQSGEQVANWTTPDFTSWGIIKSHCYIGGVFALQFTPDGQHLLLAGMGPMRDPMAGNGRQLWQKFDWRGQPPQKVDETHKGESGEGLMETLAVHPRGDCFVMAGRLRGGAWNAGLFDLESGKLLQGLKTGYRVTEALFTSDGSRLLLAGTQGQPHDRGKKPPHFGRLDIYPVEGEPLN